MNERRIVVRTVAFGLGVHDDLMAGRNARQRKGHRIRYILREDQRNGINAMALNILDQLINQPILKVAGDRKRDLRSGHNDCRSGALYFEPGREPTSAFIAGSSLKEILRLP